MEKIKIAITGGPSGGKTTLIETLQMDLHHQVAVVPEAATIIYSGGFPRRTLPLNRRHAQRAICFVQRELEEMIAAESKAPVLVCDRGSLDSIAYWPAGEEDFFKSLATDRATELSRYHWLIHLDTADEDFFDSSNPVRTESHKEALILNERVKAAWAGHPRRVVIPHSEEFLDKILKAKWAIRLILQGASFQELQEQLFPASK